MRDRKPKQTKEESYKLLKQFIEDEHNRIFNEDFSNTNDSTTGTLHSDSDKKD